MTKGDILRIFTKPDGVCQINARDSREGIRVYF